MWLRGLAVFLALPAAAAAQNVNTENGQDLFQTYCWQCHGEDGTGGGPMAEMISVSTPDLTTIAARNNGTFPVFAVAEKVDGRSPVLAHGGAMPLFGPVFDAAQSVALQSETGQPVLVSQPLADLIGYLQTIQTE